MLRRFNSLIKGPKAQSDEESTEQVSLRPARSVDSSLFASSKRGVLAPVSPLNSLLARRTEDGQTSLNLTVLHNSSKQLHQEEERGPRAFAMGRVPEERSWKEGYEQANLDSPGTPQEQYEPGEKPSDHGNHGGVTEPHDSTPPTVAQSEDEGAQVHFDFIPVPISGQIELPRISRTSSDAVVPISRTSSYAVVDIPDTEAGSGVDLEYLRKSVTTTGPGRTISSWSTDSAAEHCRICQQHSKEPLIDLGCLCRGEMAKSHKSCIEMWFKNKGTNKCEICQHVAFNVPAPETSPMPYFWVWRLGGQNGAAQGVTAQAGASRVGFQSGTIVNRPVLLTIVKKYPFIPVMWISLLAFMTYLFVDAINTSTIGYAAMPIGFLFGVLVVLGLGTAVRLIMECCHERAVERSIRQMELLSVDTEPVQTGAEESTAQNRPALPL